MKFVCRNVTGSEVPCPCCTCLNRENLPLERVEYHLLMYGMTSTYDKWILHGENSNAEAPHAEPDAEAPRAQLDAQAGRFGGLEEDDQYEDDRIPDLIEDLYNAENHDEDQGDGARVSNAQPWVQIVANHT